MYNKRKIVPPQIVVDCHLGQSELVREVVRRDDCVLRVKYYLWKIAMHRIKIVNILKF